ncbi:hypothetical protein BUALT_Bualt02G0173900 [Buddleja alternifolia]|uniref:RING-type E3 ubiquitin transferase n=1 Tax=Buddleja alternifolia TaxID=168488 RepID=A0AAV6YC21_9LAMI|nr:hypothetical protein BUALT_Bualt02G0173900 [Buddleja alternifolia]
MSTGRYFTHWCYNCNRTVFLHGGDSVCPYCTGRSIQELHHFFAEHDEPSHGRGFRIRDAFANLLRPVMPEREPHFETHPGMGPGPPGPSLIFHGPPSAGAPNFHGRIPVGTPYFHGLLPSGGPDFHWPPHLGEPYEYSDGGQWTGQTPTDYGDYMLPQMMEQLSTNDSVGPPPAPRSAINALPTIKITQRHLNTDANCPVCQDKFELGSEARKMPCNHIYHSDCIVPWLVQHNSCPVCRYVLNSDGSGSGRRPHSLNPSRSRRERRRHPLSYLWPSRNRNT